MTALLELENVSTMLSVDGSGSTAVISDVSLQLAAGETLGLVGESGSGKSMTARTIMRLLPEGARSEGRVIFDGADVLAMKRKELRALRTRRIALIFQDPRAALDPLRTCGDSITEVLRANLGMTRSAARQRALETLAEVEIREPDRVMAAYPHQLSGGMLQRILIAGAVAVGPELLIADEATTGLDVTIQAEIMRLFERLRETHGLALIFITHDLELASGVCDQTAVMYAGRIVEQRPSADFFARPMHPYTRGLLGARPRIEQRLARLEAIPGRPPVLGERPPGCAFHPRCPLATDVCRVDLPTLDNPLAGAPGAVACWHADEVASRVQVPVSSQEMGDR